MTEPEPLQQIDRTCVRFRQRKLSYFSGCDYFRLASHPRVIAALQAGVKKYGLNVAASRLTTGNHVLYRELEAELADFFAAESALLVSSGYVTNLVVAQALAGNFSHALIDDDAHPSAVRRRPLPGLPGAPVQVPGCRSAGRAPSSAAVPGRSCWCSPTGCSRSDGSAAPLAEYLKVLPKDALILVDDAHGAGVLGRTGKGTLEHAGVSRRRIIQTVTLSKAFGAYGGAILGTARLPPANPGPEPDVRRQHSPALAAGQCGAGGRADSEGEPSLRRRLLENAAYVKTALREAGLPLAETPGPIVPLLPRTPSEAARLQRALLAAGIYPPFIKYPGGPPSGYFRFVISSEHTRAQLDSLTTVLRRFV